MGLVSHIRKIQIALLANLNTMEMQRVSSLFCSRLGKINGDLEEVL